MRWTDAQIEQFDRTQQIDALNAILNFLRKVDIVDSKCKLANKKIDDLTAETKRIKTGIPSIVIAVCAVVLFFCAISFNNI